MAGSSDPFGRPGAERLSSHGMVIDTVALLRWPGSQLDIHLDEPAQGLATSSAVANHVRGELVAESMADSLSVTGVVEFDWEGACRRCLEPAIGTVEVDVQEIYERNPVEGETYQLTDDRVDLEPMLRELGTLSLPLAPLCRPECEGPAPAEFPTVIDADQTPSDDAGESLGDPRWAALDALVFDEDAE